tara:strand:+ start:378 stop:701 length:324 start_codon:yes stop_codon:yes gene_type:complete
MLGLKAVAFYFPAKMHAELKARLLYDEVPMTKFIRSYAEAYLNKDPLIIEFINKIKEKHNIQNKEKRKKNNKLLKKGRELEKRFNLSSEEVNEIYDILENEIEVVEI